jgi:SM-20-related protein
MKVKRTHIFERCKKFMNLPVATNASPTALLRDQGIVKIDNAFEEGQRKRILEFLDGPGWKFGWKSDPKSDPYSFWHKHFAGNVLPDHYAKDGREKPYDCADELRRTAPILHEVWRIIEKRVLPGHRLTRCYANGQPHGSEGAIHTDSLSEQSRTVIYYPHSAWHPNWGGETLFFNKDQTDVISAINPRPNRLIVFSGIIPHVARGVSRVCPALRITLMFKAEKPSIAERYRAFLIEDHHIDQVQHSGRDFFTHLEGTYELLRAWSNPEPVCLAGLFHSIYGTWQFRHRAVPLERREVIRNLIGLEAEFLAYAFCVTERPKELIANIQSSSEIAITDHHAKMPLKLSRHQLDRLLEIEAANLIEQRGNIRPLLEKMIPANISASARKAITEYLASTN